MHKKEKEKLQKRIAQAGIASRREAERLIEAGRIKVNGRIATLGERVAPNDKIEVDGRVIDAEKLQQAPTEVLLYHKPEGYICSRKDDKGRPIIFEQLPKRHHGRWINVGRLDVNTSGLLLITNNGELANRLMHPRYEVEREYAVRVFGTLAPDHLKALKQGIKLEDGIAKFDKITPMAGDAESKNHWYKVVLKEGRNREVRRMFEHLGYTVSRLIRTRYGAFTLPRNLSRGRSQPLTWRQVNMLLRSVGMPEQPRPDLRHALHSRPINKNNKTVKRKKQD